MRKTRAKQIRKYTRSDTTAGNFRAVYRARKRFYSRASGPDKQKLREEMGS